MGNAKVVFGDEIIVDLTNDTVTPSALVLGYTAHNADGDPIVGTHVENTFDVETMKTLAIEAYISENTYDGGVS